MNAILQQPDLMAARKVISIDLFDRAMQKQLADITRELLPDAEILEHVRKLTCNGNTYAALSTVFSGHTEFNVHLEDDTLPAMSAGAMMRWASEKYRDDKDVFTIGLWRHADGCWPGHREEIPNEINIVRKQWSYGCWGWGTWPDRWKDIESGWTKGDDATASWDYAVGRSRGNRCEIVPLISRCQNIGHENGTHRGAFILPRWAEQTPAGEFIEG
jgi:hypothetical protein